VEIEQMYIPRPGTHGLRDVFWKNKCYRPDDNVVIHPDDKINAIIQPNDITKY
jgi:hypothetical protein